jgi:NTE family protein
VLPGGGARAAYQVGVLKAIAAVLHPDHVPFVAITGISAGSINAAGLAQGAEDFVDAVERLERLWTSLHADDIFETEAARLQHFVSRSPSPVALFDNAPLAALLERELDREALDRVIRTGVIRGLAISASNYTTGDATTFVHAGADPVLTHHMRRDSVRAEIGPEHLLASSALPLLFPPQRIGDEFFVDGSLRMTAPLSPAINLGADRILVIAVRNERASTPDESLHLPGIGEIGGYTLESLFSVSLNADLERMEQINELLTLIPRWRRRRTHRRKIEVMVIRPSEDLRVIAARFSMKLPRSIRLFLRALGGWGIEWRLPSYLLFEAPFTAALIDLGYRDGLKQRPALEAFFS